MIQNDFCQCGSIKIVNVIMRDGSFISVSPGSYVPADPNLVMQIEVVCQDCGKVHGYTSLMTPIELYQ